MAANSAPVGGARPRRPPETSAAVGGASAATAALPHHDGKCLISSKKKHLYDIIYILTASATLKHVIFVPVKLRVINVYKTDVLFIGVKINVHKNVGIAHTW